jgi:hypothetical protein
MRAHDEADVLEPEVDLIERPLELGKRSRLVHPGVDEDDAVACRDRPRVAMGHARPRQRQAQTPQSGEDTFAASELSLGPHTAHDIGGA